MKKSIFIVISLLLISVLDCLSQSDANYLVGSKWLFKETRGMAISFEITFKGDGTALLQGTNTPINEILKWSGNADDVWMSGNFGAGSTITLQGGLNSGILDYSSPWSVNGKSGNQSGQYQATKTQSAPEPSKTKEQRKAENVETGAKILDGLLDAFEKRKEERAKKQAEQQAEPTENEPEPEIQQPTSKGKKESKTKSQTANSQATYSNDDAVSAAVIWQHTLSNHSTISTATFALKACIEISESVKEYILVQDGRRLSITRGLIVRKANDCANAFNQTVTLTDGENQFQLIAKTNSGDLKSEIFTIYYSPNATVAAPIKLRRLALIIGNAAYPNAALKNPVNDATDVATALREMGFEVISATNANRRKMNETIDDFGSRLKNYDVGFFYYAGHGMQVQGENYLVPIDAKPQAQGEVEYDCYPVGKILAKMEDADNQANIIVLDACRDNPLQRSWSRSTGSNGLANINAPQGTFIGFATSPGSTAADGTGRNGIYTGALLQHIRKSNLTVDQLFNAINGTVKKQTNNQQIPWKVSSMSEDLYLTNK